MVLSTTHINAPESASVNFENVMFSRLITGIVEITVRNAGVPSYYTLTQEEWGKVIATLSAPSDKISIRVERYLALRNKGLTSDEIRFLLNDDMTALDV